MSYFPRLCLGASPERHPRGIPAGGAVAGLIAAADRESRRRAFDDAPAGFRGTLFPRTELEPRESSLLLRNGINVVEGSRQRGGVLHGNATLAGSAAAYRPSQRLDRRRLLCHVLESLERHTRWALTAEWDRSLQQRLIRQAASFLAGVYERGALRGARPEQAYFVKLQAAVRDPDRELVVRVGLALDQANEYQIYDVIHRPDGSRTRIVPPIEAAQLAS